MFFYFHKQFSVAQVGSAVKHTRCEKCGADYRYEAIRRAIGAGSSPYGLCNTGARNRAAKTASHSLEKMLKKAIDPVACPDCGWFQSDMIRELRRRDNRWMLPTGIVPAVLLWACALCIRLGTKHSISPQIEAESWGLVLALTIAGLAFFVFFVCGRSLLGMRIDPNRSFPRLPALIRGGPVAMKSLSDVTGAQYEPRRSNVDVAGWVTVQLAKFRCPSRCCSCMSETQDVRKYNCARLASVVVPLCAKCSRRLKWKRGLIQLACAVAGAAVAAIIPILAQRYEPFLLGAVAFGGFLVGVLFGDPVANHSTSPVAFSRFRSEFNTVRLKFRNARYLECALDFNEPSHQKTTTIAA